MALQDELAYITLTELAARIRARELSPVEAMDATIAGSSSATPASTRSSSSTSSRRASGPGRPSGRWAPGRSSGCCTGCPRP